MNSVDTSFPDGYPGTGLLHRGRVSRVPEEHAGRASAAFSSFALSDGSKATTWITPAAAGANSYASIGQTTSVSTRILRAPVSRRDAHLLCPSAQVEMASILAPNDWVRPMRAGPLTSAPNEQSFMA